MNASELRARMNNVFQAVFEDENLTVDENTTATDISGWDSLTHVQIIVMVEKEFGVRFKTREVAALQKHGDLEALVLRKLEPAP